MNINKIIFLIVVSSLSFVMLAVTVNLMHGLFDPRVDNKEIFAIISPDFHTIIGAFIGILSAQFLNKDDHK